MIKVQPLLGEVLPLSPDIVTRTMSPFSLHFKDPFLPVLAGATRPSHSFSYSARSLLWTSSGMSSGVLTNTSAATENVQPSYNSTTDYNIDYVR